MATQFTNQLQPSNSTDALFRAWVLFVQDAFASGGWNQTGDTGQINALTVTAPSAGSQVRGYAIYRMGDALQVSFPVYVKVSFGSGSSGAAYPAMTIEVGTGSDGSGNISGSVDSKQITISSTSSSLTSVFSYSSASPSHVAFSLFQHATSTYLLSYSLERGRTSAGDEDGARLLRINAAASGAVGELQALVRAGGTQSSEQSTVPVVLSATQTADGNNTVYGALSDLGFGAPLPVESNYALGNPGLGYIFTPSSFMASAGAVLTVFLYGAKHKYRRMDPILGSVGTKQNTSFVKPWQRYE